MSVAYPQHKAWIMSAIPPNNLDQLIAWVRLFSEETTNKLNSLEIRLKDVTHKIRRMENEQSK